MGARQKIPTSGDSLILYKELSPAEIRATQRRLRSGELKRIYPGVVTNQPEETWASLIARERIRVLAALFPQTVMGPRTAFHGGTPQDGTVFLSATYARRYELPGLTVQLVPGHGPATGDLPMMGRPVYFPSPARTLLENLVVSRASVRRTVGRAAVEQRLLDICAARGEEALLAIRDQARELAPTLGLVKTFTVLDDLIGTILGTRKAAMQTAAGKGLAATVPWDAARLALFEQIAAVLRATPLKQIPDVVRSEHGRMNFAFLESYFSNFIEGTEFEVNQARGFVLEGKPILERPKDSHDILGVFRQAVNPGWANQTLSSGEPVLEQLKTRHADQMKERPEKSPGEFKSDNNRFGSMYFVDKGLVRGTLIEGSRMLPTIPDGLARALFAMFLVAEVHPFNDGNGRLARLVMNAELSVMRGCRIIIPTLFREEYLDCLRVLSREHDPVPFLNAMQKAQAWTAAFDYENLDQVIADMAACNAFERSLVGHKLLFPDARTTASN